MEVLHENILDTMAGKTFIDMKKQQQLNEQKSKSVIVSPNNKLNAKKVSMINEKRKRPYSSINARLRRSNYSINLRNNLASALSESKNITEIKNKSYNLSRYKKRINNKATNISRNKTIEVDFSKSSSRLLYFKYLYL